MTAKKAMATVASKAPAAAVYRSLYRSVRRRALQVEQLALPAQTPFIKEQLGKSLSAALATSVTDADSAYSPTQLALNEERHRLQLSFAVSQRSDGKTQVGIVSKCTLGRIF